MKQVTKNIGFEAKVVQKAGKQGFNNKGKCNI